MNELPLTDDELRSLEQRRDALYTRLEADYVQIGNGDPTTAEAFTPFWIAMLREYEAICKELQEGI